MYVLYIHVFSELGQPVVGNHKDGQIGNVHVHDLTCIFTVRFCSPLSIPNDRLVKTRENVEY